MDVLKKIFPLAFSVKKKDTNSFVVQLIIAIAAYIVASVIMFVLGMILPLGLWPLITIISSLIYLYATADIVFCILRFTGVLKDAE